MTVSEAGRLPGAEAERRVLDRAVDLAREARELGQHPFGAVLTGEDGTVLAEARNSVLADGDCTAHAELKLLRSLPGGGPSGVRLYASAEPCAMCAGAIVWSGVRYVAYALSRAELAPLTSRESASRRRSLDCRTVLTAGAPGVVVRGPVPVRGAREVHVGYWF